MNCIFVDNPSKRELWNQFVKENNGGFLQCFQWGDFQLALQKKVWRIQIVESGKTLLQAQIIKEIFPFKKGLLYIPFGPIFLAGIAFEQKQEALMALIKKIREIEKTENSVALLIEPLVELPFVKNMRIKASPKRFQPRKTQILALQNLDEIFKKFPYRVRYNIRLAEKNGVEIISPELKPSTFEQFYSLLKKTSQRHDFRIYSKMYFEKMLAYMQGEGLQSMVFFAMYEKKLIAESIVIVFGSRASYLYGASDHEYRAIKAPDLLQWRQISEMKNSGAKEYDFWGIDEKKWPGLTKFKKDFGGKEFEYPEGKMIPLQPVWYALYAISRKLSLKHSQ